MEIMAKTGFNYGLYEDIILHKMISENLTLSEALFIDMIENEVDPEDVYQATDYLEGVIRDDLDKVEYLMMVLTGRVQDSYLIPLSNTYPKDE